MSDDNLISRPLTAGAHVSLRSMQEVAMNDRNASKMLSTYNVAYWGGNYYDVNELGHISVCPDPDIREARVDLAQLVKRCSSNKGNVCLRCSASHKFYSIVCVQLTRRLNVRVSLSAMKAATSWFTPLK